MAINRSRTSTTSSIDYPEKLQSILEDILGSSEVYFQPPSDRTRKYPCIEYALSDVQQMYADNKTYLAIPRYTITHFNKLPDMTIPNKILKLPTCSFLGFHKEQYFNVYTFNLYFKEDNNHG